MLKYSLALRVSKHPGGSLIRLFRRDARHSGTPPLGWPASPGGRWTGPADCPAGRREGRQVLALAAPQGGEGGREVPSQALSPRVSLAKGAGFLGSCSSCVQG